MFARTPPRAFLVARQSSGSDADRAAAPRSELADLLRHVRREPALGDLATTEWPFAPQAKSGVEKSEKNRSSSNAFRVAHDAKSQTRDSDFRIAPTEATSSAPYEERETELVAGGDAHRARRRLSRLRLEHLPGRHGAGPALRGEERLREGKLVDLVAPSRLSPSRALTRWPEECGGCDWTALRLDHQLHAKRRILSESLRRIGKFDVAALPAISFPPSPLNYRLRSRLHRDGDAVGFYALRSNRVIPLAP